MIEDITHAGNLDLIGGQLCLDFVNTLDGRRDGHPHDYLNSYSDLVAWSQHVGLVTTEEVQQLNQAARERHMEANKVFERAIELRETNYRIFEAITNGERPAVTDLTGLNEMLSEALAQLQVVPATEGFEWGWRHGEGTLEQLLWPVARSAAELLTSPEMKRVRECGGENCDWLFLDTSRNGSRRWCDMKSCGNRAKAKRHYKRTRTSKTAKK